MTFALYMDHHVPKAITNGLRLRDIDVLTAHDDGADELDDTRLLDRANELKRILFTQDDDLLAEAAERMRKGTPFYGLIYAHQLRCSIGTIIRDLEIIAKAGEVEEITKHIQFLPL